MSNEKKNKTASITITASPAVVEKAALEAISHRYDIMVFIEYIMSNGNGDPDNDNQPRALPDGRGIISPMCLKRFIRNYAGTYLGYRIYISDHDLLSDHRNEAYAAVGLEAPAEDETTDLEASTETEEEPIEAEAEAESGKKAKGKKVLPWREQQAKVRAVQEWICKKYYDARMFGLVIGGKKGEDPGGSIHGPFNCGWAVSLQPINAQEHCITRCAVSTEEEARTQGGDNRTIGRTHTVPAAVYVGHFWLDPYLAQKTGVSMKDFEDALTALRYGPGLNKSTQRPYTVTRRIVVFQHADMGGQAQPHKLYKLVNAVPKDPTKENCTYDDYTVTVDTSKLPDGVTVFRDIED
jgi:CRISPR-associated protein Csd2